MKLSDVQNLRVGSEVLCALGEGSYCGIVVLTSPCCIKIEWNVGKGKTILNTYSRYKLLEDTFKKI